MLTLLWIAGCGSTPNSAPVLESSYSNRTPPQAPSGRYRVQRGDTLFQIAFDHGLDYRDLATWNELSDPGLIRIGELLRLTPPARVVLSPAISPRQARLARVAKPKVYGPDEEQEERIPDAWVWPSKGPLLLGFGEGLSKGLDIGGERGQRVQAAASGKVVYAGSSLRGYGKLIIIRHGKTLLSAYAHNARILVNEGRNVVRGQVIAEMGDTDADRIKLHFEIREYGKPVDPLNYLPKQS